MFGSKVSGIENKIPSFSLDAPAKALDVDRSGKKRGVCRADDCINCTGYERGPTGACAYCGCVPGLHVDLTSQRPKTTRAVGVLYPTTVEVPVPLPKDKEIDLNSKDLQQVVAVAQTDNEARCDRELSFQFLEKIIIVDTSNDLWWRGFRMNDNFVKLGYFPKESVKLLSDIPNV